MKKIMVLLFLYSLSVETHGTSTNDDHEAFAVTIITSPREGPFRIGQQVNFSCVVDPEPPDSVTYQWRSVEDVYGGSSYSRKNFSRQFYHRALRYCWFFCEVMLNQTLIGSTSRLVEVSGLIYSNGPNVRGFVPGESIILNVNISDDHFGNLIPPLAWYHNGSQINSTSTVTISDNGTSLSISNMETSGAGIYEAKIVSFNTEELIGFSNDRECDLLVLPLLESLAIFAPVTFRVLQEYSVPQYSPLKVVSTCYLQEEGEQKIELSSVAQVNFTFLLQYENIRSNWYRNGQHLPDNAMYNATIIHNEENSLQLAYNSTSEAVGNYVGMLWIYDNALRHVRSRQCTGYYYLLSFYVRTFRVPLFVSYWKIKRPLQRLVYITIQQSVIERGQSTMIWCNTAASNCHDIIIMTLWRNKTLLAQVQGNQLNYSALPYMYGSLHCSIGNNVHSNVSTIQEKVPFQLLLPVTTHCDELQNQQSDVLRVAMRDVFSSLCLSCDDISTSNIQNMQVNCSDFMYLTADLVYSDPAGRITASTLLYMLSTWMISQENPFLLVNGQNLSLIQKFPVEMNTVTKDVCIASVSTESTCSDKSADPTLLITGVYFGGLVSGVFATLIVCGIIFCVGRMSQHCINKKNSPQVTEKTVDISMETNQAYETVDVRYAAAGRGSDQDEAIYETPAPL